MVDGDGHREAPKNPLPPAPAPAARPPPPKIAPAQGAAAPAPAHISKPPPPTIAAPASRPPPPQPAPAPAAAPAPVPAAASAPPRAQSSFLINPSVPWPRCVPGESEATLALRGEPIPDSLRAMTERIISELSPLERSAIRGEPVLVENAAALRKALVCLWQLGAALALKPTAPAEIDSAAAEALLASVDSAMANLRAITEAQPEVAPALEGTRKSIANKAVSFSEALQQATPAQTPKGVRTPSGVKMLAVQTVDPNAAKSQRRRAWLLGIGLGLMVVVAAGYHLRGVLSSAPALQRPTIPGAPDGLVLISPPNAPAKTLLASGPIPPQELEHFKAQLAAGGQQLIELGGGRYSIVPSSAAERSSKPQ